MERDPLDDAYVCVQCFEDEDLQGAIAAYADDDSEPCSFCGEQSEDVVRCRFTDLMSHIRECIERDYDLAANNMGWESKEGGWLGAEYWDTPDLLREQLGIGLPRDDDNALFSAMCSFLEYTDWCRRNPYGESRLERLQFDWDELTDLAKHHTRFFLGQHRRMHDPIRVSERASPTSFLQQIGTAAGRLNLFSTLHASTTLHRARFRTVAPRSHHQPPLVLLPAMARSCRTA